AAEAGGVAQALVARIAAADIAGVRLAVDRDVDRPLEEGADDLVHGEVRAEPDLEEVDLVDVEAEALDARDGHVPAVGLDVVDQAARVVEAVADVGVGADRQALLRIAAVGEISRAERAQREARAAPFDADAAGSIEQPQLELPADVEDPVFLRGQERLGAELRVAE